MKTSQQALEWRLPTKPKPKKSRQISSKVKIMLTVFFEYRGVMHSEFLPKGQTGNKENYLSVKRR
jgi:[histone H3]-lysine36 N-dimethyltransferase SETMAR